MEGLRNIPEAPPQEESADKPESIYRALKKNGQEKILRTFTPEQQSEIKHKQNILSSLAYFIGKDFKMPVELNAPGAGWHWDFENNVIRIDPTDLLERPMDYLRFVISHEGGHRRISRTDFIPVEEWKQPGFAFMMNVIEDPRDNNFVAEVYPKFREQMKLAYEIDLEKEVREKAEKKLGRQPRFMQAGIEYIRQWFRETEGLDVELSEDLPEDVRAVVAATLESARDSWLRYPSREEADESEELISKYAQVSYEINRDEVWPRFKELVEADIEDQKLQEAMKDMAQKAADNKGGEPELPQELKDQLTPEEQEELKEQIKKVAAQLKKEKQEGAQKPEGSGSSDAEEPQPQEGQADQGSQSEALKADKLSEELKKKIKDYIDSLPEEIQKELVEKAKAVIKEFEESLNEELQGRLTENPEQKVNRESQKGEKKEPEGTAQISAGQRVTSGAIKKPAEGLGMRVFSEQLAEVLEKDENAYEKYRREVLPLIDQLENELRQIFVDRKTTSWKGGFQTGKRIDIKRRIQEKAKDIPAMESRAWQKRELPEEKDYAISLLVDISGSMFWDEKSKEALKSVIVLAEVLNRLGLNVEILGFNDEIREYQTFDEDMSKTVRERIGQMLEDAASKRCNMCKADHNATDIGWATETAAEHLAKQKADNKFLITISDYQLEESPKHPAHKYNIKKVVDKILGKTDIRMIGLGIGRGTDKVSSYYPNSLPNVSAQEMAEKLAGLIKEVIANYDNF